MKNISDLIHKYNLLCTNYFMENGDTLKHKKFFNIKTLNTICKNLYVWKKYDLVEQCFKLDGRTYLYLLKRLICLGNTNQFLYWFNKYNIDWKNENAGLEYLLIQILKYDNTILFKYFIDNFNIKNIRSDFYIKTILHIPYKYWGSNIYYVLQTFLTVKDIPDEYKTFSGQTLWLIAKCFEHPDTLNNRIIQMSNIIREHYEMTKLTKTFKKFVKNI